MAYLVAWSNDLGLDTQISRRSVGTEERHGVDVGVIQAVIFDHVAVISGQGPARGARRRRSDCQNILPDSRNIDRAGRTPKLFRLTVVSGRKKQQMLGVLRSKQGGSNAAQASRRGGCV